jgi:hypothetical protein
MFYSDIATAVRTALVAACLGTASISLVSGCGQAPPLVRAATSSPGSQTTAIGSTPGSAPATTMTTASGVYGDPDAAAKFWQQQSLEDNCGLASVADVVGEVTGHAPTESQIIKLAQNTPSSIRNGPIYLPTGDPGHEGDNGGIDKHPEEVGLPKLEEYLGANRKIIAWVNSGTILNSSDQRATPDHFLVVTGIDTNNEVVHLNDPYADHPDTKVSIAKFMTAWKIGQESIVVTAQAS